MQMTDEAAQSPPADGTPAEQQHEYGFTFTGSGREYFRIWIVNLALTIATLGIYSAWAKVRRMQYFYRNTQLDDCAFNFHADPKAILRGRLIAVALLIAYQYSFGFSLEVGIAMVVSLILALPFLMMNALRFRLRNTSYRGLRFGFAGGAPGAYLSYAPVVALFLVPGALAAIPATREWGPLSFLAYLGWPFLYAGMKRYQHANLRYAQCESGYTGRARDFFVTYLKVLGLMLAGLIPAFIIGVVFAMVAGVISNSGPEAQRLGMLMPFVIAIFMVYLMYLITGPYAMVRLANLVWNNTRLSQVSFDSHMRAGQLVKLQTVNALLTLFTLGLYRPFAVVSVHRFRVAHFRVQSTEPLGSVLAGARAYAPGAAGDAAADMLGFDLSW